MNSTPWMAATNRPQPWLMPLNAGGNRLAQAQITMLAGRFDPISLDEMEDVALLNRIDTKFVMTAGQLVRALSRLQNNYWMLEVNGQRLNHYRTLYFDTPDFELYQAHVNDRPERYKVRSREYTDTNLSFLEVKHRTRKDRTIKERIRTAQPVVEMTSEMGQWLEDVSPLSFSALEPKLWNTFTRVTLVDKNLCERVTLDTNLTFYKGDRIIRLDGIAVAELKMDASSCVSSFLSQMRSQRIRTCGFSKYAMGAALLYEEVKKNRLKPKMLWIEKLMKGSVSYE